MKQSFEKIGWNSVRLIPFDEMKMIHCEFGDISPDFVFVTEVDYRRMTEAEIVNTLFDMICNTFSDENDPANVNPFAQWQLDKLDRYEACYLREYIHFSLEHDRAHHPYGEPWQQLADDMVEYAQKLEQKYADDKKIVYVCPGGDYRVYCLFSNDHWRVWDASGMLNMHLMKQQKDPGFFNNEAAVLSGTLAWDITGDRDPYESIDIDPGVIWEEGQKMSMPEMVKLADSQKESV